MQAQFNSAWMDLFDLKVFKERYNLKIIGKTKNFVRKIFDVILNIQNFCCYECIFVHDFCMLQFFLLQPQGKYPAT